MNTFCATKQKMDDLESRKTGKIIGNIWYVRDGFDVISKTT